MKASIRIYLAASAMAAAVVLPTTALGRESVSSDSYVDDWPFSFDSGVVTCEPPGNSVILKADGKTYALNGKARGQVEKRGYVDVHDVMPRDDHGMFKKGVNTVSALIKIGLRFCK